MKLNLLTFMLPRRLARSMTRNFFMRSLGGRGNSVQGMSDFLFSLIVYSVCLNIFHMKKDLSEGPP